MRFTFAAYTDLSFLITWLNSESVTQLIKKKISKQVTVMVHKL